ncbi:hypothetical protein HNQ57_003511 [Zhongshania antarctica]|uniref:Uncharacterized protein n=1 Tax=Zhongshania antarctica TaxID=641702 RepID=A0A840R9K8_9GAMM|nr:hypothetical protein [Zhongshania antarctica]
MVAFVSRMILINEDNILSFKDAAARLIRFSKD